MFHQRGVVVNLAKIKIKIFKSVFENVNGWGAV